jgi:hypothetical protein
MEIKYPTRCKIIDVTGQTMGEHTLNTPETSHPHIGKEGKAWKGSDGAVRIRLDDGNILMGYECWWTPLK